MKNIQRRTFIFVSFFIAITFIGFFQSWNVALGIFNLCIISAIMALGVNIQLGYAGIFNAGVMGFAALGGLAAVIISHPPVPETIKLGGSGVFLSLVILLVGAAVTFIYKSSLSSSIKNNNTPHYLMLLILFNLVGSPAIESIEAFEPYVWISRWIWFAYNTVMVCRRDFSWYCSILHRKADFRFKK